MLFRDVFLPLSRALPYARGRLPVRGASVVNARGELAGPADIGGTARAACDNAAYDLFQPDVDHR